MSYTNKKDAFGRDIDLRNPQLKQVIVFNDYITNLSKLLSKMGWAEFSYAQDEEEERNNLAKEAERKREDAIKNQHFDRQKKAQIACGNYELEEGEIIE